MDILPNYHFRLGCEYDEFRLGTYIGGYKTYRC